MLGKLSSEPRGIQKVFTNDLFFRRSRRLARYVKTLPKALRTQASTALPSNLVWIGGFGLVGLAQ